jgi:hypothetical protein
MTLGPRAKLALILGGFALPIVASFIAFTYVRPSATSNYGELLLPPDAITASPFMTASGTAFRFRELAGRWILVTADRGPCGDACKAKLVTIRQVRLALGKEADRVAMVTVIDGDAPARELQAAFPGMVFVRPTQPSQPTAPVADAAHIHLVDPLGNVMMRWPAAPDHKRMKGDLDRLLKASQIG